MAINQFERIQKIVKVAEVRKQRAANASADARRKLAVAEEERKNAAARVQAAQATLRQANNFLLQNPETDQLLVWRSHCSGCKDQNIAAHLESEQCCTEAEGNLSKLLIEMHRQDLRYDYLVCQAKLVRQKLVREHEAKVDDETQGCGQRPAMQIFAGSVLR
jgi:hypothetical protein